MGALWRLAVGDELLLGQGNLVWTMASLSYAMGIMDEVGGKTNARSEVGALVLAQQLALDPWERRKR